MSLTEAKVSREGGGGGEIGGDVKKIAAKVTLLAISHHKQ